MLRGARWSRPPGPLASPPAPVVERRAGHPTFLLGVGAQKAGTSWLHQHLAGSPQCVAGYRKEYHVFDALDLPSEAWMRARIDMRARREGRRAVDGEPVDATGLHRAAMLHDTDFYFDHFTGLLSRDPAYRLTLDMTPDYGLLSPARLRWISDGMAARGVRTVAVLLLRDPVERIWSHVRMEQVRRPERFPGDSEEHVRRVHEAPAYADRSRYDRVLASLEAAFAPERTHVGFYERLFDPEQVAAVERLAGIDHRRPDVGLRVNGSPRERAELSADTVRQVACSLRPAYDAVARRFPEVDLVQMWPSARWVI